jgi:oxalate decarboxylase/phosphoglucose isomerase-like protein (cupin superfamily)
MKEPAAARPTKRESIDTYKIWQQSQKIPSVTDFYIEDLNAIEVAPWELKGGLGAFVNLEGTGGIDDAYVCEIPPGGKLKPQKHLFEEMVYIVKGRGGTTVWQKQGKKHTFEWHEGSLFAIPLNASYQHFNGSGTEPARYFAVTNAPLVMNIFHSVDFILDNDFAFVNRFDPNQEDYFTKEGEMWALRNMAVNFIPDVHGIKLIPWRERGGGGATLFFDLASQLMQAHISQFVVGTYKKAHRHGPGAHVVILSGQGYSLLWPEDREPVRVDWKAGSVVVPPSQWFHQHFNSGATPARYLALRKGGGGRYKFPIEFHDGDVDQSVKEGGAQIEYQDEDPKIHQDFEASLARVGTRCAMAEWHPRCTAR